jgi:hypothetical protein
MTEGIIPIWYEKHKGKILSIDEVQELIAEIKKLKEHDLTTGFHLYGDGIRKLDLIGDTST